MAFCSLVYSVVPVPALTRLIFTFGYSFSKAVASCLSCGAQAHQVSVVGVCSAAAPLLAGADEPLAALAPAAGGGVGGGVLRAGGARATGAGAAEAGPVRGG